MTLQESQISDSKFPWRLTSLLYGLSFAPQLLSANKLFWDDWIMFDLQTGKLLTSQYSGGGNAPWRGWIESFLFQSSLPVFRFVSFVAFFFMGYFLFHILKRAAALTSNQIIAITVLFLMLPVNSARISIVCSKYSVAAFFFFLGWYLYETKNHKIAIFAGYIFFFLSYSELPFPTFTLLPILYHIYLRKPESVRQCIYEFLRTLPLVLLPIVYLAVRSVFWPPSGNAAVMYGPQLLGAARAILFVTICSVPLFLYIASCKYRSIKRPSLLVSVGVFSISLAAFPYMVGGHLVDISDWLIAFIPNFSDWNSRHQLLLPLGFALIIGGSLKLDSTKPLRWTSSPVLSTIVACCVVLNVTFAQEYFLDGKKQDSIMAAMANSEDLKNASAILVDDSAVRFNARGRGIRSYEWEGMLQKVFGERSRKVSQLQYVDCKEFQPDAVLRISAPNGRLESTLRRNVAIDISVEQINPCGN
jgi:hypothetical protein